MEKENEKNTKNKEEGQKVEFAKYFDDDGNEIEAIPKEKAEELLKSKEEKMKELESEIKGYKDKDFNWKALRDAKKEEREKFLSELSEKDKQIMLAQEETAKQVSTLQESLVQDYKDELLEKLAGDDKDLRKKIEYNYDRIEGNDTSKKGIKNKIFDAFKLSSDTTQDPISSVMGTKSAGSIQSEKKQDLDNDVKNVLKDYANFSDDDLKKYGKGK